MTACSACGHTPRLKREVRVGDVGTVFVFELKDLSEVSCDSSAYCDAPALDISAASALAVLFRKPDGTVAEVAGTLTTDGTDGKMEFATVSGTLDMAGPWKRQARVTFPGGDEWSSSIVCFEVHKNLDT